MKRVIRNAATGKFYAHGKWVDNAQEAQDFPALVAAIETVVLHRLNNVEVILDYGAKWETRLPFGTSPPSGP